MKYNYTDKDGAMLAATMGANATEADINNVARKMNSKRKGPLAKIWDKVVALWEAFKSPDTPKATKALVIGGLIYMVTPLDLIPDCIPGLGLTDDVAVICMVYKRLIKLAGSMAIGVTTATVIDKCTAKKHSFEELEIKQ